MTKLDFIKSDAEKIMATKPDDYLGHLIVLMYGEGHAEVNMTAATRGVFIALIYGALTAGASESMRLKDKHLYAFCTAALATMDETFSAELRINKEKLH